MTSSVMTRILRSCAASSSARKSSIVPYVELISSYDSDVVAVVLERRRIEREQPDGVRAELPDVVQLLDQAAKIAEPIAVGIAIALDVELVDDRVLVPERIGIGHDPRAAAVAVDEQEVARLRRPDRDARSCERLARSSALRSTDLRRRTAHRRPGPGRGSARGPSFPGRGADRC